MTSLHRLIAIVVIWAAVAFAAVSLFGSQFLRPLPIPVVAILRPRFGATAFLIYRCGAAEPWPMGSGCQACLSTSKILSHFHTLALPQQREVLALVRTLATTAVSVPSQNLLAFAGAIEPLDLTALQQAIDVDCEQVN